jgi:hypothetical protein
MDFKTLYHELEYSTDMIRSLLAGITQEESRVRPAPDSWSILEVVCHLHDEELEDFREHLDFILHRQAGEWHTIDPQGWVEARRYNDRAFAQAKGRFFEERRRSLEWLLGLMQADWEVEYTSQFGSMKAGEMLACWVAHDNLHIRQLVELRRTRIEKITEPYPIGYAGDWQ